MGFTETSTHNTPDTGPRLARRAVLGGIGAALLPTWMLAETKATQSGLRVTVDAEVPDESKLKLVVQDHDGEHDTVTVDDATVVPHTTMMPDFRTDGEVCFECHAYHGREGKEIAVNRLVVDTDVSGRLERPQNNLTPTEKIQRRLTDLLLA